MKQEVQIKYINEKYNLGLISWKEAYLLGPHVIPLKVEYYKGNIVYRAPGSAKRIYYKAIKASLKRCNLCVHINNLHDPF
jgi:hypothetical protein